MFLREVVFFFSFLLLFFYEQNRRPGDYCPSSRVIIRAFSTRKC